MTLKTKHQSESPNEPMPDPKLIAQQLRRPSGDFASKIGHKMNEVNKPLYDLVFNTMELRKGDSILEIGFGNGKFFDDLLSKGSELKLSGLDFSEAMVKFAKQQNEANISSGNLNIKYGNSSAIPFPDDTFDKVFCTMVIYFWEQPMQHLAEIRRILKSDGKFYTGMRSHESMLAFPFVKYDFRLHSTEQWEEILINNGFSIEETHSRLDPEMEVDSNKIRLESCCVVAKIE